MAKKKETYPKEFLEYIQSITNKRARIVLDHILKHNFITTEDLEKTYGYNHPPRAARDVREAGVPLETFKIKSQDGKSIAAYRFGDLTQLQPNRVAGRILFAKKFKKELLKYVMDVVKSVTNNLKNDIYRLTTEFLTKLAAI